MASTLKRAIPCAVMASCMQVAKAGCWGQCHHGSWTGGLFGHCECDEFYEGECCNKPMCESIEGELARDVSLDEWVRATWYIQEQQITGYQPRNSLYCVTATYNFEDATVPQFIPFLPPYWDGTVVSVYNQANLKMVNGDPQNDDNMTLCARLEDPDETSKLSVAPCFLPNYAAGPYWILSLGENDAGQYDWAIVIGGEPTVPYADGCTTSTQGVNGAGLWLFSRTPVASNATLTAMYNELDSKGISRSQLIKVEQKGCTYESAFIKENSA